MIFWEKNTIFKFGSTELHAFETIRAKLIEKPVLALYSPQAETQLHCDASRLGFGGILLQCQQDNKFHPISYFSKRTSEHERKYHSFELETLAIIYSLQKFRIYLQGLTFKIFTDCDSLKLCLNKKTINPRIARWALAMQEYQYTVEHRENRKMQHLDALSRCHNILILEGNTLEQI